jgi:hypothetical protein
MSCHNGGSTVSLSYVSFVQMVLAVVGIHGEGESGIEAENAHLQHLPAHAPILWSSARHNYSTNVLFVLQEADWDLAKDEVQV